MTESSSVTILTDASFEETIQTAGKPVFVDFYADWCGPCQMVAPIIEKLAGEYADQAVVAKINIDENRQTASQFGVMSIPTVMVFKFEDDVIKVVASQVGFAGEAGYKQMLDEAVK